VHNVFAGLWRAFLSFCVLVAVQVFGALDWDIYHFGFQKKTDLSVAFGSGGPV
jgi:hypothetical protein